MSSQTRNELLEEILSAIMTGGELTPEQMEALDSILALSDGYVPIKQPGTNSLIDSEMYQDSEGTLITPGAIQSGTNTFKLDLAWLIDSAGYGARMKNVGANDSFNITLSRFQKERHPGLVRVRNGNPLDNDNDFALPVNTVDTDVLTNPEYTIPVIPPISDEQGQTATTANVKIDASSVMTNWVLEFRINGTLYTVFKEPFVSSGDYVFTYEPEIDIPAGAQLDVKIYSTDGDVKMLGDAVSGFPYIIQNVQQYNDKDIYHLEDEIPTYKSASTPTNELFINNAETIVADTSASSGGGFALDVDVSKVEWFKVFDFDGTWRVSRPVTINLSNGDTYTLTRRNREYFFYKDEQGDWKWYYNSKFAG